VQIAKLRFFISLIVHQKINDTQENRGIRPLPNLEIKLVAANSLIGVEKQSTLRNPQIAVKEVELRRVRERHFMAKTPRTKAKYREEDAQLRSEISELLRIDGFSREITAMLAYWDPYDQNASAPFFDSEWMFGLTSGSHICIGNPPYGASFSEEEKQTFLRLFRHQDYQLDSYLLFAERAFDLLCGGGVVAFIIPNPWLTNLKLKKIRRFIFAQQTVQQIAHYSCKVFDAIVDTQVVIVRNERPRDNRVSVKLVRASDSAVTRLFEQQKWASLNGEPVNIFVDSSQERLIEKLKTDTVLFKELCDVTVGVKPYQVGKGVPKQTRSIVENRIFDSTFKKDDSYRPLLRGRDIDKYVTKWDGNRWIKYGNHLAEPRPSAKFDAPTKIVMRQTGDSLIATLDRKQFVCMNNMHTIVPHDGTCDLRFMLGFLNSRLLNFYFQWLNPEKGEALAEVKKEHVERLVIKRTTQKQRETIVKLVDRVLAAKEENENADTSASWKRQSPQDERSTVYSTSILSKNLIHYPWTKRVFLRQR
jgi:hypothetical protein